MIRGDRTTGIIQLMAGALMISFSAVFVELAHTGPTVTGFYRMLFGGTALLVLAGIKREPFKQGELPLLMLCLSALAFSMDLFFWHRSVLYIGPGLATLLANFEVFFLAGFGILIFRERLDWRMVTGIPLGLIGLYLIVGINWDELGRKNQTGVWLGLITALCYAGYILFLRKARTFTGPGFVTRDMAFISLAAALLLGLGGSGSGESFKIPDLQTWGALLAYGIVAQVLGWVTISKGLPKVEASRAGLILLLQPTLAFVWDVLFFKRPVSVHEAIGAALALCAIYLGSTGRQPRNSRKNTS
jgi:drug/metabolite transporter (DMT)-like permease